MANGPKEMQIEMGNTKRSRSQRERKSCVLVLCMRENTWHTQQIHTRPLLLTTGVGSSSLEGGKVLTINNSSGCG